MGTTALILGGGYAGVMAANRLAAAQRPGLDVQLITPEPRFVERIRLHEYAAGTRADATVSYGSLLHPAVRLISGSVERISVDAVDAGGRSVLLADGRTLAFDYLVYAAGSGRPAVPAGALAVQHLAGAAAARRELAALPNGARVAVVGGGITAVETAGETARRYPHLQVALYCATLLLPGMTAGGRHSAARSLARAGVALHEGTRVPPDLRAVSDADIVLWCTGFSVPAPAAASGLPVNGEGRLRVDSTLRMRGQDRIYAAGDAAGNILRSLDGKPPTRHESGFAAQCISLGRSDGLIQFVTAGDTATRFHARGRTAAVLKEIICRSTLRWIRSEAKRSGAYTWPRGPREATTQQRSGAAAP